MVYPQYFKIIKVEVKDIDINWYDSMHFEFGVFVKATDIKRCFDSLYDVLKIIPSATFFVFCID